MASDGTRARRGADTSNRYDRSPMARKDRAPNPPKRPQAPQRRSTPSGPRDERQRRLLYIVAATGLIGLAIVLGVVFLAGGGGDDDLASTMESAGCELKTVQAQVGDHSAELDATSNPKWNTDPPTSGPHNPTPAVYGEYPDPLEDRAGRAQPRARRRLCPLWAPGTCSDRGAAERLLQRGHHRDAAGALPQARQQGRARRLDGAGRLRARRARTAPRTSPRARSSTRTRSRPSATTFASAAPERFPPDSLAPGST